MKPHPPLIAEGGAGAAAAARVAAGHRGRRVGVWRALAALFGVLAGLLSVTPAVQAAPVTYAFTGVFDVLNGSVGIYTDKPFAGSFTYDPAIAPQAQAQPGAAIYDALIGFDLEILDVPASQATRIRLTAGAPTAAIGVDEATNGAPSDAFTIRFATGPRARAESLLPWDLFALVFRLERVLGSVFDDALSLPPTLDLGDFDRTHVDLLLVAGSFAIDVDGRLTSLRLIDTPPIGVPEPGTFGLAAVATAGLAAAGGRRRQRCRLVALACLRLRPAARHTPVGRSARGVHAMFVRCATALSVALVASLAAQPGQAAQRAPARAETAVDESATQLAVGANHSCQLGPDGKVRCWGANSRGQLGDGSTTTRLAPVPVGSYFIYVSVSAGLDHTCALTADGQVWCWGANQAGQLGSGNTTDRPWPTYASVFDAVTIASGNAYSCALLSGGAVRCWGDNSSGQLGDGTVARRLTPVPVRGLSLVTALAAGAHHACALLANGSVRCWGRNFFGQLGDGTTVNRLTPVTANLPLPASAIAVGSDYTCAVLVDGTARCWGFNFAGQLGDGTTTNRTAPTPVSGLSDVVALTAGDSHTCAQIAGGAVYCWGNNGRGQLGDATTVRRLAPVGVNKAFGATAVEAGVFHTCATFASGFSSCWGFNAFGQIGDGTTTDRLEPAVVRGIAGTSLAERVAVGERHSCAVRDNGTVACWGENSVGQLGDGTTTSRLTPTTVGGQSRATLLTHARAVAAGDRHTCAQLRVSILCWGDNSFGQLGDGTTTTRLGPVAALASPFTEALAVGDFHNCILLGNGTVRCWGRNDAGQLGDGTTTHRPTPVEVVGLMAIKAIVAGAEHSCALHGDGAVSCWGRNNRGQLGHSGPNSPVPVRVDGLANIIALAAGNLHTCGLTANGFAICWGANHVGQLGNGSLQTSSLPTVARVRDDAIGIAAGDFYGCALLRYGAVSCWGRNSVGQLGDGTTTDRPTPVLALNPYSGSLHLSGIVQIAAGTATTCARSAQGALHCWGWNSFGQIGNGTTVDTVRPVTVPSFTLNIDPVVSLRRNEKGAILRVQAVCDPDQRLFAAVSLTQDQVVAQGHAQGACTGRLEEYPVKVHAPGAVDLLAGEARVEAVGEIVVRGQTVQVQQWGRQVTISTGP